MQIFKTVSFKIWGSFTLVMSLLMIFLLYYYPLQQQEAFIEFKKNELHELANSLKQSIEASLKNDDFTGLKESVERTTENKDFDFVAVVMKDSGKEYILAVSPAIPQEEVLKKDLKNRIYETADFSEASFKGEVVIAFSKERIFNSVKTLNQPIYLIMGGLFMVSLIMFYFLAKLISKPINDLTKITKNLKEENFSTDFKKENSSDEIGQLSNAIMELSANLQESRSRNKELTEGLENEIKIRTEELQTSTKKLIDAQLNAGISNFEYSFQEEKFTVAQNFTELLGFGEEVDINRLLALVHEEDLKELQNLISENQMQLLDINTDIRILREEANQWLTFSCICRMEFDSQLNMHFCFGTLQDITYRKKIENELRELSLVAKNTSNCVIITDENKVITWVNESVTKLTGYSFEEIIGNSPKMFQFEKTDQNTVKYIRQKLANNENVTAEILNIGKHGNEYWLELNISPLFKENSEVYGYMAVETDITELKNSEESIRKMNETLEQRVLENTRKNLDLSRMMVEQEKLATIGEISAGIAHDLNTPLGAAKVGSENLKFIVREIKEIFPQLPLQEQTLAVTLANQYKASIATSGLQKLKDKATMEERLVSFNLVDQNNIPDYALKLVECGIRPQDEDAVQKIFSTNDPVKFLRVFYSLQLMDNLVEGIILSTEKASNVVKDVRAFINKGVTPERQLIDLESNIQVVLNVFSHELRKNIKLAISFEPSVKISGFDVKLFQLWSNIIKNALDAMDSQTDKMLSIATKTNQDEVIVEISNNGPKISEEIIHSIFKKFFSTKREKNGTGLGLSIVKNVLDEHGASIQVESSDELTTFRIVFPNVII